jgi:hypothetical protein
VARRVSLPGAAELFRGRTDAAPPAREPEPSTTNGRPSGRQRHDEKITVYVSSAELMALEHARLALRGEYGLAVDRGRVVREALAVVLADLDAAGEDSVLVRRLRD